MPRSALEPTINLHVDILPMDAPNRPGPRNGKNRTYLDAINYITVHETDNENRGADADAHRRFLNNGGGDRRVSWHYTVDEFKVWQHLRPQERGIHANRGNRETIGIETCVDRGSDLSKTRDRAARLVALLMLTTNLKIDKVVQHNFWSGKNCPSRLRGGILGMDWNDFLVLAEKYALSDGLTDRELATAPDDSHWGWSSVAPTGIELEPEGSEDADEEDDPHLGMPDEYLSR